MVKDTLAKIPKYSLSGLLVERLLRTASILNASHEGVLREQNCFLGVASLIQT